MSTLASNEIRLDTEREPGCLVCCYQDLAGGTRNNYAGKTNLSLAPAKRKKKKKPKPNKQKHPHFCQLTHQVSWKEILQKNFLYYCYVTSALLIFYMFHGSQSLHLHLQGLVAKVEFYGGHRTELSIFLCEDPSLGKNLALTVTQTSFNDIARQWQWSQSIHRLKSLLGCVQLAVVKFFQLGFHVYFWFHP